jgi:tRNA (mo5U34)-methyltransferase
MDVRRADTGNVLNFVHPEVTLVALRIDSANPDSANLLRDVNAVSWWHKMDLGNGVITPGPDDPSRRLPTLGIPKSLNGKTVLDIGAWDGFYSFEAERRGAKRVLATDSFCWGQGGWGSKAGFELARRALNSKVEDMDIDVMELSADKVGTFDVVFFFGVLYHLRHPLLALERVASVTGDQLILETNADLLWYGRPAMVFYPERELNDDPTNWWGPNLPAVVGMLKAVGFSRVEVAFRRPLALRLGRAIQRFAKHGESPLRLIQQGRIVVHAWQ